jgi:peptidoglycan/xylan/chitin deacetylase (PgdA/CDA1 family)
MSLNRRKQGSARILYYHRVNDEGDLFFDAMSTTLFEKQMRYLARHYRVASMKDILEHLEDGDSQEMLVGITFDDGYEDNYRNAFPILRRYNLPATIFLTTGSVDSGEPLWFERLAEALQKSSREFIDVEIGVGHRFWMRTLSERLNCKDSIFALLRSLDDKERRRSLAEILAVLGAPAESGRRNKMLSWEQARAMMAHGIEFGGHTVSHPFFSRLSAAEALWEASECKYRIEQELQRPVDCFAYPNGREEDLGIGSKDLLRAAGYRAAVTTIWGMNSPTTDRMELRRGGPWEDSLAVFAYKFDWYQFANQ